MLCCLSSIQFITACEVSKIQELPTELILIIARKAINRNEWQLAKSQKEVFGDVVIFLSICKQFNEIKKLLLESKDLKELRDTIDWEWVQEKMKDYEHSHSNDTGFFQIRVNALHIAVLASDHNFLSHVLPKLSKLREKEAYRDRIKNIMEQYCDPDTNIVTPLRFASYKPDYTCTKLLLENGASIKSPITTTTSLLEVMEIRLYQWWKGTQDICFNKKLNRDQTMQEYLKIIQLLIPITEFTLVSKMMDTIKQRGWEDLNPMERATERERKLEITVCQKNNLEYNIFINKNLKDIEIKND